MSSPQKLKKELDLNTELTELLDVLKGIASSQFRALEKKKERFTKFMAAFEGFFQMIDFSSVEHPFAKGVGKLGIIMITSDEGFMGGLNTRVIQTALAQPDGDTAELIVLGGRGADYLRGLGRQFTGFPGVASEERYEEALQLKDHIMKEGLAGTFARLILVYPKPVSFTVRKIEVLKILPCTELFAERKGAAGGAADVITESAVSSIVEYLVEVWIIQKLLEVLEDSKLAEFSARTVHLEESHHVLLRRGSAIQFQYFRSHHDLVDKGMRETFSAQIIRKGKAKVQPT